MGALGKFSRDLFVALGARVGDVELVHLRARDHRAIHLVGTVAVDAVGRFDVSADQRGAVHAAVEGADELCAAEGLTGDAFFPDVARLTLLRLRELLGEGGFGRREGDDRLAVAREAVGRVGGFGREGLAVG